MVNLDMLNDKIYELGLTSQKVCRVFRLVAGDSLCDCARIRVDILSSLKQDFLGTNEDLTEQILLDSLILATANKGENLYLTLQNSQLVAKSMGCTCTMVSVDALRNYVCEELQIESYIEKSRYSEEEEKDEKEEKQVSLEKDETEVKEEHKQEKEEPKKEPEKEEKQEPTKETEVDLKENEVMNYYSQYCNGVIQELIKRYTAMFSSGYELERPAGLLTSKGIVKVSGSTLTVHEDSVSTNNIYCLLKESLNFNELEIRSIVGIANAIYDAYKGGDNRLLYFPNKMVEFAYGLCAPDGDNQNSTNTYKKHSSANSWRGYCSSELEKAVKMIVRKTTYGFISNTAEDGDYKNPSIIQSLGSFLKYMQDCLSLCLLFPEYKVVSLNGDKDVSSFKLRLCDPQSKVLGRNLTPMILDKAFMGGVGTVPFSYPPRVESEVFVVEYSHEFNHDMAQSTPLFAYKALEALKNQGVELSFENLILGKAEDGSILRSGTKGIDLSKHLTHNIVAGSQAGKGVMTLNILASGIASNKNIIYLDRKPDMASLLKYLAPNMPVINGGRIQSGYDSFNQWQDASSRLKKVPDEVLKAFDVKESWNELGDLIYMRLLKLVIGLLMIRGTGHAGDFGGDDGILLIVDEFTNFQRSYMSLITSLTRVIPSTEIDTARKALEDNKINQATFNRVFNNTGYYALSYINSIFVDVDYLKSQKEAGYDPLETSKSNVFVIGQSLEKGLFDFDKFRDIFKKGEGDTKRYKSIESRGLSKGGFSVGNQSLPFNIVNFKTADAFFGRNMDDGRSKYLAQTDDKSKAKGRLDDKASNFAYLDNFTEVERENIVNGSVSVNIEKANKCIYFKPFLILNSSGMSDKCVLKMFDRVEKNAGISKEDLILENPSYSNPSNINEAVGFIDYIKLAGISNAKEVLEKSSNVLNNVVRDLLKYPGDWFDFITDFSPEWLFTIKDITDAAEYGVCDLHNPLTNPILKEYVDFNPSRFAKGYEDETTASEKAMDKFFFTESTSEDFSDMEKQQKDEDERLGDVMGDFESFDPEEEIDLEDEEEPPINLNESEIVETGKKGKRDDFNDEETQKILDLIKQLNDMGVDIQIGNDKADVNPVKYQSVNKSEFGEELENLNYENEIDSLSALMSVITEDVLEKFGGLERITSFKVVGGSLVVNGYYYRCKVKDLFMRNIPYDIRRDINSGNVSKLFDYSLIDRMLHLRDLEFDSVGFTYDYVSSQLGYGSSVSVDKFFDNLRSLQVLTLGKHRFTRGTYLEEARALKDDIFYKPSRATVIADASENFLGNVCSKSWAFTKKLATNKNCNFVVKSLGVVAGTSISATTGLTKVGSQVSRKAVKQVKVLSKSIKNLFNS